MEGQTVIKFLADQLFEVFHRFGGNVGVQADQDLTVVGNVQQNVIGFFIGHLETVGGNRTEINVVKLDGLLFAGRKQVGNDDQSKGKYNQLFHGSSFSFYKICFRSSTL